LCAKQNPGLEFHLGIKGFLAQVGHEHFYDDVVHVLQNKTSS
jgi:hypothetical protein